MNDPLAQYKTLLVNIIDQAVKDVKKDPLGKHRNGYGEKAYNWFSSADFRDWCLLVGWDSRDYKMLTLKKRVEGIRKTKETNKVGARWTGHLRHSVSLNETNKAQVRGNGARSVDLPTVEIQRAGSGAPKPGPGPLPLGPPNPRGGQRKLATPLKRECACGAVWYIDFPPTVKKPLCRECHLKLQSGPLPRKRGGNLLSLAKRAAIEAAVKAGKSNWQIIREVGVGKTTAKKYADLAEATRVKREKRIGGYHHQKTHGGQFKKGKSSSTPSLSAEKIVLIRKFPARMPINEIAKRVGVGWSTVKKYRSEGK